MCQNICQKKVYICIYIYIILILYDIYIYMSDIYIYVYCVILVQLQRFMNEISSNEFFRCFSQALPTLFFPLHPTLHLHPTPVAHPAGELTYPVGQLEDDFPFPFSWDIFWDSFPGSLPFFSEKKNVEIVFSPAPFGVLSIVFRSSTKRR